MGLGRVVRQSNNHSRHIEEILRDPDFDHVYFDISWDEVAKYIVASPEATKVTADLMQRYPDRFLFGTDAAAPTDKAIYTKVFHQYEPLWKSLDAETSRKVRLQNYERVFDDARRKVRSWERAHVPRASLN
jgi:phosphoserine phosphatase